MMNLQDVIDIHDKAIKANEKEKYELGINVTNGKLDIDRIKNWINLRIV